MGALGKLFLLMVLSHTTCCKEQCVAPQTTHHIVLLGKKMAKESHSIVDTVMSLREHLGEGGGGRKEEAADSPAGSTGTCPGEYFPSDSCPLPSLHLASWEVGMLQAFADSSFISNDSLSLLRSRCCLSPARSREMLKSIHAHEAIEKRE